MLPQLAYVVNNGLAFFYIYKLEETFDELYKTVLFSHQNILKVLKSETLKIPK